MFLYYNEIVKDLYMFRKCYFYYWILKYLYMLFISVQIRCQWCLVKVFFDIWLFFQNVFFEKKKDF